MGIVGVGHQEVVVPDHGHAAASLRALVDGDALADLVAVADQQTRVAPPVLAVLGRAAQDRVRVDRALGTHDGGAVQDGQGHDLAVVAQGDTGADVGVRAHADAFAELSAALHDRGGMVERLAQSS